MSLMDLVRKVSPTQSLNSTISWHERMAICEPDKYVEIAEVVCDFLDFGRTYVAFPSQNKLWRFLSGRDIENPVPPVINCGATAFNDFLLKLKHGQISPKENELIAIAKKRSSAGAGKDVESQETGPESPKPETPKRRQGGKTGARTKRAGSRAKNSTP